MHVLHFRLHFFPDLLKFGKVSQGCAATH